MKNVKKVSLFLIIFSSLFLFTACGKKLDLSQFASVNFTGIDTEGEAHLKINWDAFNSSLGITKDMQSNSAKNSEESLSLHRKITEIQNSINYDLDKTYDLKNGDTVNVTIDFDEKIAKKYKLKFSNPTKAFTVSGLNKVTKVDLFKDISLEFSGISPNASVTIKNSSTDPVIKDITFSADETSDITSGDIITVTAIINDSELNEKGYITDSMQKTFVADNIQEYVPNIAEISEANLKKLENSAEKVLRTRLESESDYTSIIYPNEYVYNLVNFDSFKLTSLKLKTTYFLKYKDKRPASNVDRYNMLFFVYEVKATTNKDPNGVTVYVPVFFENLISPFDESQLSSAKISSLLSTSFENVEKDCITSNTNRYNTEVIPK